MATWPRRGNCSMSSWTFIVCFMLTCANWMGGGGWWVTTQRESLLCCHLMLLLRSLYKCCHPENHFMSSQTPLWWLNLKCLQKKSVSAKRWGKVALWCHCCCTWPRYYCWAVMASLCLNYQKHYLDITGNIQQQTLFFAILLVCFVHYSFFKHRAIMHTETLIPLYLLQANIGRYTVSSDCLEWFNSFTKIKPLCTSLTFAEFCSGADTDHNATMNTASLCVRPPFPSVSHTLQLE